LEVNKEGYPCLLSGGAPDSPVHHRTATVHVGARSPSYSCETTVADSWRLEHQTLSGAHRTMSGAHRTVRCPMPTISAGHVSPAGCAAHRCAGGRWLTRQSGAPLDSPVNYSRTPPNSPESDLFTGGQPGAPDTVPCTTGQSGVPE
jgi:hypothetical protein